MLILFLFCFLIVFSQTHVCVLTKPTTMGNCTYCFMSHSEEIKYIAENTLSIGEAG